MAEGVAACHAAGSAHNEIANPNNMLIFNQESDATIKLCDFGRVELTEPFNQKPNDIKSIGIWFLFMIALDFEYQPEEISLLSPEEIKKIVSANSESERRNCFGETDFESVLSQDGIDHVSHLAWGMLNASHEHRVSIFDVTTKLSAIQEMFDF